MRGAPGDHGKNRHDDTRDGPDHDFDRRGVGPLGLVVSFGVGCAVFPGKSHDHEEDWNHDEEHEPGRGQQQRLFLDANISLGGEDFHVAAAKQHDRADAENARKGRKEGVFHVQPWMEGGKCCRAADWNAAKQQRPSYRFDLGQACDEWSHCLGGIWPLGGRFRVFLGEQTPRRKRRGATICRTCTERCGGYVSHPHKSVRYDFTFRPRFFCQLALQGAPVHAQETRRRGNIAAGFVQGLVNVLPF
ncbi:hypothetical protein D3C85_1270530 [compost metagenome]